MERNCITVTLCIQLCLSFTKLRPVMRGHLVIFNKHFSEKKHKNCDVSATLCPISDLLRTNIQGHQTSVVTVLIDIPFNGRQ